MTGLERLKLRAAQFFSAAPFFFVGVVIAVAVLFRFALGAVKPPPPEPDLPFAVTHVPLTPPKAPPTASVGAAAIVDETASAPKPAVPRRKSRTLGKR